jgi:hypothetical protein
VDLSSTDFHPNGVKIYSRLWDNIAFIAQIFRELRITQRFCTGIFRTKCHQNRPRNIQITGDNSLTLLIMNATEPKKLTLAQQLSVKNYNTEFHKYPTKAFVADNR